MVASDRWLLHLRLEGLVAQPELRMKQGLSTGLVAQPELRMKQGFNDKVLVHDYPLYLSAHHRALCHWDKIVSFEQSSNGNWSRCKTRLHNFTATERQWEVEDRVAVMSNTTTKGGR